MSAAVRPDWTGAEAPFGYEDALKPVDEGKLAWNVPATLVFLLRAAGDPKYPYVLILDEMNCPCREILCGWSQVWNQESQFCPIFFKA